MVGDILDSMFRSGVTLARSVELTVQWDRIVRDGPVGPVTLEDFRLARLGGLGGLRYVVGDLRAA